MPAFALLAKGQPPIANRYALVNVPHAAAVRDGRSGGKADLACPFASGPEGLGDKTKQPTVGDPALAGWRVCGLLGSGAQAEW
ncbi:hypothetical protein GC175_31775 [bacterium]|nr:hypothetical protein [bacterium]